LSNFHTLCLSHHHTHTHTQSSKIPHSLSVYTHTIIKNSHTHTLSLSLSIITHTQSSNYPHTLSSSSSSSHTHTIIKKSTHSLIIIIIIITHNTHTQSFMWVDGTERRECDANPQFQKELELPFTAAEQDFKVFLSLFFWCLLCVCVFFFSPTHTVIKKKKKKKKIHTHISSSTSSSSSSSLSYIACLLRQRQRCACHRCRSNRVDETPLVTIAARLWERCRASGDGREGLTITHTIIKKFTHSSHHHKHTHTITTKIHTLLIIIITSHTHTLFLAHRACPWARQQGRHDDPPGLCRPARPHPPPHLPRVKGVPPVRGSALLLCSSHAKLIIIITHSTKKSTHCSLIIITHTHTQSSKKSTHSLSLSSHTQSSQSSHAQQADLALAPKDVSRLLEAGGGLSRTVALLRYRQ